MNVPEIDADEIEWTRYLVKQETITPSKNEKKLLQSIAPVLQKAGFTVSLDEYDEKLDGRCSLCARLHPEYDKPALCFGGHIDTVPFGTHQWEHDPLLGEVIDGYLCGRGSCDMKSGVGAMLTAAINMAPKINDRDFVIHLYGGEEQNDEGSTHLVKTKEYIKNIAAVVICEPTSSKPLLGHRGVIWLRLLTEGKTAHACMPELGDNALVKMLKGTACLADFSYESSHEVLGRSTFVLSSLHSGLNVNSVPDSASMSIDIRTVPSQDHKVLIENLKGMLSADVTISPIADLACLWTEPDDPFVKRVFSLYKEMTGTDMTAQAVQFATDGAALRKAMPDCPIVILGPGDTRMAHQLNEACAVSEITFTKTLYEKIITDFYSL